MQSRNGPLFPAIKFALVASAALLMLSSCGGGDESSLMVYGAYDEDLSGDAPRDGGLALLARAGIPVRSNRCVVLIERSPAVYDDRIVLPLDGVYSEYEIPQSYAEQAFNDVNLFSKRIYKSIEVYPLDPCPSQCDILSEDYKPPACKARLPAAAGRNRGTSVGGAASVPVR